MRFRSTNAHGNAYGNAPEPAAERLVSFQDAVLGCLPADGGLYVPGKVVDLRQLFLYMNDQISFPDFVAAIAPSLLEGELNPCSASRVAESAFNFEPELIRLDDDFSILNLYNGPTGLFKDFGIAFLAAAMEELRNSAGSRLVLAAVHGDTGVSMAHAFRGRKGIGLVLVYPSGPIRGLDPAAFVSNGGNIIPVQIQGTFDDCQRLVNETINDRAFAERYNITSANSINPGRLLPQVFYYLYAFVKVKKQLSGSLAFSVPCGNFGNLIAGLYAWKFGMPVNSFIAAMNANNALGEFIKDKPFIPRRLITTSSPALDVCIPSNLSRLASFYREAPAVMRNMVYPASVDDAHTLRTIEYVWKKYRLHIDPHTAVAFAAAGQTASSQNWKGQIHTVVLATGHYAKNTELVQKVTGQTIPELFQSLQKEIEPIAVIPANLDSFEGIIASCF
ncbi:MAG: threonine synthase [Treponema sp.]|nr:threonine synthase [Treponema sp.]